MDLFIADTHFDHASIIIHCNRPFHSVDEMNQALIESWNSVVDNSDTVFFIGDFSMGRRKNIARHLASLNGYKILMKGNHDKKYSSARWIDFGFDEVVPTQLRYEEFVLTHRPLNNTDVKNIHGHTHNNRENDELHFCVSVEMIGYKPITIEQIRRQWVHEATLTSVCNN